MSINGALHVGRSALAVSQAALQMAGNNMANAATPGYHRRSIHLGPLTSEQVGRNARVGRGVEILSIRREVDTALQSRHRDAISSHNRALVDQRFLSAIETLQNELSDNDLSSTLSRFFNSFSELANSPQDSAVRAVVVQEGAALADRIQTLRSDYNVVLGQVDNQIGAVVQRANDLLDRIQAVNAEIINTEGGGGQASSLRDQRDVLIDELAQVVDVDVIEHGSGSVDVFINSTPILLAGENRGLEVRRQSDEDGVDLSIRVAADGTTLNIASGELGGLLQQRESTVGPIIDNLNTFAGQLIHQVNLLHAQGQGRTALTSIAGTQFVDDPDANLNAIAADIPFDITNGSFQLHVTHAETGIRETVQINVDGDAQSLNDVIAAINGAGLNVTASLGAGNALQIDAAAGYEVSFAEDSSGFLAALGLNTFFAGHNASNIEVHEQLRADPGRLAAGANHLAGSSDTAVAIANLQNTALDALGGSSIRDFWVNAVGETAVKTNAANDAVESTALVMESLDAQIQGVSGVSLDEESINLITFQRQFQAAARFINVIDETLQTLLSIAR